MEQQLQKMCTARFNYKTQREYKLQISERKTSYQDPLILVHKTYLII